MRRFRDSALRRALLAVTALAALVAIVEAGTKW